MGILNGSEHWRDLGVGPEVNKGAGPWLREKLYLKAMTLGVSCSNDMAFSSYKNIGFDFVAGYEFYFSNDCHRMSLQLSVIT
jgi:hypothetical protein